MNPSRDLCNRALLIYALWYLASPQVALWVASGVIVFFGFPFVTSIFWGWYYHFKKTPRGAMFDRRIKWLIRGAAFMSIIIGRILNVRNF